MNATTAPTDRPTPLRSYWANRPTDATHRTVERGVVHATAARDTDSWPSTLTTACGVTTAEQSSWSGDDTVTCRRCIRVSRR